MTGPLLFSPFSLGGVELPNRIVLSPMGQHMAADGDATDWHLMHLGQYAISGAGLLLTESVAVDPDARISLGCLGLWSEANVAAMARIAAFVHDNGESRFGVQLNHAGRKGSVTKRWERSRPMPPEQGGWTVEGASGIPYPGRAQPVAIAVDRLGEVREHFARAGALAARAGAEVIEIHAAHGYLLHSFLSPLANDRTDRYGGDLDNRMRFPLEVFEAVRDRVPANVAVGVRVSATDWTPGGLEPAEIVEFCRALRARGCDYVCASSGGVSPAQEIPVEPLYQVPFAEQIRREAEIATIAVGLITRPAEAEAILQQGRADLVALGRVLLRDPRWPWKAAAELGGTVRMPRQYV